MTAQRQEEGGTAQTRETRTLGSIVIPAHNEASVVARTLRPLASLPGAGVELVVVANGCSDSTAATARAAAPGALVLETPIASKVHALRLAEAAAPQLPRLYVDADVQITARAVLATLEALSSGAIAARPPICYDTAGATWPVRRYFGARRAMPSMNSHAWGAGVYGLSAEARRRFDEFPNVIGDDLFVDRLLTPGELVVVDTDPVVVTTPKDRRSLLKVLRRAQRGKSDETAAPSGLKARPTETEALRDLPRVLRSVQGPADAVVYAVFALAARLTGRTGAAWERDESSRNRGQSLGDWQ